MTNEMYYGDNLKILDKYIKSESVDLIYLDPPFNSQKAYNILYKEPTGQLSQAQIRAFEDTWSWNTETENTYRHLVNNANPEISSTIKSFYDMMGKSNLMSYLVMMTPRLIELHRTLKSTGSLFLHCDPTASHYLKIILDSIFDVNNFKNEIIWHYRTGGIGSKWFGRKHDIILFYTKTNKYKFKPIEIKEYYADIYGPNFKPGLTDKKGGTDKRGPFKITILDDVWDIRAVFNLSREFAGYPTQKPLKLLERIIQATTEPDDIIMDPFCGCGTALIAAQQMRRDWIGIDITYLAINVLKNRFSKEGMFSSFNVVGEPTSIYAANQLAQSNRHEFATWIITKVHGKPFKKKSGDKGIDGFIDFFDDEKPLRGVIQVKSGGIGPGQIRDFCHVVKRDKAPIGVFITLKEPTIGMRTEAAGEGYFTDSKGNQYPKIQIITVGEIIDGKKIACPQVI